MAAYNNHDHPGKKLVKDGIKHLVLCEGRDAKNFLIYYLNSTTLSDYPELSVYVQVEDFGGNEQLNKQMQLWTKAPGFNSLKTLVVIRDAETNAEGAMNSVISSFRAAGLPVPESPCRLERNGDSIATGFVLFPSCDEQLENGTLEDLCLSILEATDNLALHEIENFLIQLKERQLRAFPREHKTKLHTYFSITDDYVSLKIGEAASAGAFDWSSTKLQSLRNFLISML